MWQHASGQSSANARQAGVYGLDTTTGKQLWYFSGAYVSLLADNGICIAGGNPHTLDTGTTGVPAPDPEPLTALDTATGATRWVASVDASGNALAEQGSLFVLTAEARQLRPL